MRLQGIRNQTGYALLAVFAIGVGLYPFKFIDLSTGEGFLSGKAGELLESTAYLVSFFLHIFAGGIALLTGFTQFFPKIRKKLTGLHRFLGKVYVGAVLISGSTGLAIAYFATGGMIPALGFASLAIAWLYTTLRAYSSIRNRKILHHRKWMTRSYALCFAAVTLRIYLPVATVIMGIDFIAAYSAIAWLCWVPNLLVAEYLIWRTITLPQKDSVRV